MKKSKLIKIFIVRAYDVLKIVARSDATYAKFVFEVYLEKKMCRNGYYKHSRHMHKDNHNLLVLLGDQTSDKWTLNFISWLSVQSRFMFLKNTF